MASTSDAASRPTAVFVHGVGLDASMWDAVFAALASEVTCVAFTMPGHRGSPLAAHNTLDGYVAALADFIETLDVDAVDVVGFSMGAMVAAGCAAAHPSKVSKLVLMNAVHRRDPAARMGVLARLDAVSEIGLSGVADAALARWFSDAYRDAHPDKVAEVRRVMEANDMNEYLRAYGVFATADAEVADLLPDIRCPVFALTGEFDANSTPAMSRDIAAQVKNGRHAVLPGLAHGAPIEAPHAVADILRTFLVEETVDA